MRNKGAEQKPFRAGWLVLRFFTASGMADRPKGTPLKALLLDERRSHVKRQGTFSEILLRMAAMFGSNRSSQTRILKESK
jgi:hypothetical protein